MEINSLCTELRNCINSWPDYNCSEWDYTAAKSNPTLLVIMKDDIFRVTIEPSEPSEMEAGDM